MPIAQIDNLIRYVTNAEGKATDVLVPIEIWQQLIYSLFKENKTMEEINEKVKRYCFRLVGEQIKLGSLVSIAGFFCNSCPIFRSNNFETLPTHLAFNFS